MNLYIDAKLMIIYGLSHDTPKGITRNNADLISIGPSPTYLWENIFF